MLVFFDDILVYNCSLGEHQTHLSLVLKILETHQLFANEKKCRCAQSRLEYFGHIIYDQGMAADAIKVEVVLNF